MTTTIHKAQELHSEAQRTGDPEKYERAAELYRKAYNYDKAHSCERAAELLRQTEQAELEQVNA